MNEGLNTNYSVADVFECVGIDYFRAGDYDDADLMLTAALDYAEREDDCGESLLTKLNNLAVIRDIQGQTDEADELFQRALECVRDELGFDSARVPELLCNYSILLGKRDEYVMSEGMSICADLIQSSYESTYPLMLKVQRQTSPDMMEQVA